MFMAYREMKMHQYYNTMHRSLLLMIFKKYIDDIVYVKIMVVALLHLDFSQLVFQCRKKRLFTLL